MTGKQAWWLTVSGLCLLKACCADVSLRRHGDVYTFENARFTLEVDAAGGGRVRSWVVKPSGRELVALWRGGGEIGGALDDRAFFTASRYDAAILQPGPQKAVLRLEAKHASGLAVVKVLTVVDDESVVRVSYEFRNGSQAPASLWIRNFFLPGRHPQTESNRYWVHGANARTKERADDSASASGYYQPAKPEWAALWDRATGDGVYVFAPGADRFYFWRGSVENPTFEWIYPELQAGRVLRAQVVLGVVTKTTTPPLWSKILRPYVRTLRAARTGVLTGWVDEATRFRVTQEERQKGFWLSIGRGDGKRRLPQTLPVDLPLNDDRWVSLTINVLRDLRAPLMVTVPANWTRQVKVFRDTRGKDRRELLPLPGEPLSLGAGTREVIWFDVSSRSKVPGVYTAPLVLHVGRQTHPVTLRMHVWPVRVERRRPFHVRGYCGGYPVWTGGYEVTPAGLARLNAILTAYADIGGDVLDWNAVWARIVAHVKLARTGEDLVQVAQESPGRLELRRLPRLDFSYFDPWFAAAKDHGVTRVETYVPSPTQPQLSWRLLDAAVGKGRAKAGSPDARRVIVWFFAEMKRYLQSQGFEGFFGKVSDEISPEYIPTYLETAAVAREAGWRPFTTITGMIARTASLVEQMDPQCDEWQLSFGLKDDFLRLLTAKFELAETRIPLPGTWGQYTNGGAKDTWTMRVFGPDSATGIRASDVESFRLLEDGKPLHPKGGSPWGNRDRGIVCTAGSLKTHLYVSTFAGDPPARHRFELVVNLRRESPHGRPLVTIDSTDEVWCYGGGSRPYRRPYDSAWVYPLMTLFHGFEGYGLWAFYHWNKTERIVWFGEANQITVSPCYCGYRDGWRDSLLLAQLMRRRGRAALAPILGENDEAVLRVGVESREVYHYRTILNAADPLARNRARAAALKRLSEGT